MLTVRRGNVKKAVKPDPRGYKRVRVRRRAPEEEEIPPVPPAWERRKGKKSPKTKPTLNKEGPADDRKPVVFGTYTVADPTKLPNVKIPVDPSGAGSGPESSVIAYTGNVYLAVSTDSGATFKYFDPTTMFPTFAGGILGDQQLIYVPAIDRFVWCMLHGAVKATGDGAFRLAIAKPSDVALNPKTAWLPFDFVAADIGVGGSDFDQPHITFSGRFLIIAIDVAGQGRVVVRIPLTDLTTGSVNFDFTEPLTIPKSTYAFSAPCQGGANGAYLAGHVDTSTLRVFSLPDSGTAYDFHDVKVTAWSESDDYSSKTPSGIDWSGRCRSRVSGATSRGKELWFAWMAPRSKAGETPSFPQPQVRVAVIDSVTFANVSEMQVWNPDFAFGYVALATNSAKEVALAVAWGGKSEADAAFGIIGDFVVWYRDGSTATVVDPAGSKKGRWGDYLRTHPAARGKDFHGFGYFTVTDGSGAVVQNPYYVRYGHP